MAEDEGQAATPPDDRPITAHKDKRKVPGGFGVEDMDDLSPSKPASDDDSILDNSEAKNTDPVEQIQQSSRLPSLDHATLPFLPPPGNSSLLYPHSENDEHMDSLDEGEMQRHLNDVESSFLPAVSPIATGKSGVDDTYLFDSAQADQAASNPNPNPNPEVKTPAKEDRVQETAVSPPTPDNAYQTPGPPRAGTPDNDTSQDVGNTTSSLETMSSSPTAAAAARTISRAISQASHGGYETANDAAEDDLEMEVDPDATPRKPRMATRLADAESSDGPSILQRHLSPSALLDAGSTPGHALLERRSSRNLPRFLRSRHGSQRSSSNSSFHANDDQDESETNYGADYALQSGGAVPANGMSRTSSVSLQRSISLGSMASGIDDLGGDSKGKDRGLTILTEEQRNRGRREEGAPTTPETPRATSRSLAAAPTDTIIARHVRNVQVPESLAKEYRTKSGVSSPKRNGFTTSTMGRNGKNLTLKEQSSTIERLSKENFDLKLKVMFLSDRLDKLSEEGVREMISENVELKTGLAVMQRDNKALRRKVKELEKQAKENEGRPGTARSGTSTDEGSKWFDQEGAQEREEELLYLRERVEEYVTEIEKLRNEAIARENEKRNLAEVVRSMGERRGQNLDTREEMDVWKDLLEQETARREQGDEDIKKLREEIFRLKSEASSTGIPGLNHTTNIYNITKKRTMSPSRESRPTSELSQRTEERNGAFSAASTLVEELKKETEQLRHENAELRREVGAQTSMLTSRNREKERLYQEIEDLKLGQRRGGGSVAGDSILERSASRAGGHVRSSSRVSAATRQTGITDVEREDYENKNAELRDKINSLKLQSQDLQRELDSCMEDFETAAEQKKDAEVLVTELQEALEVAENDLLTMQADRDEALQGQDEAEHMFEGLRKEAQEELDGFAAEVDDANMEIERLQSELGDTQENFSALQNEMRQMSEALVRLEDDQETHLKRIEELEKELDEANKELEQMETNLVEANGKINRLTVQQESSQGEIAFLREEQDGDKIKIGDLEAAIRNTEQNLQEERDRCKELEQRIADERYQREVVASQEKTEVQQFVNELNREASNAKDDSRKLRRILTTKEVEAAEWKERLMELESNLREALGDLGGTRSSFLKSIAKLQRELENTVRDFDSTKASLAEKERIIKQRDSLLESQALESRRLGDLLEKERQSHRNTKHQFETYQKTQQHTTRSLSQQESRVMELENSRQQDRRKIAMLETTFKDQLTERNNLLLALWNRLSTLCGSDWTHNNSLISGRALPSLEAVSTMLPGFSKNLFAAVKHLESTVVGFKAQIRAVERELWKEYQNLEYNLDVRSKRIDRLETMTKSGIPVPTDGKAELVKLRDANKSLKSEISTLRAAYEVRSRAYEEAGSPSPSVPTGPRSSSSSRSKIATSRTSTMTRHHSNNTVETIDRLTSANPPEDDYKPDLRWQVRLQELEYKLKAEREARKLDRSSARQRLEEKSRENAELAAEVERGRLREDMRS